MRFNGLSRIYLLFLIVILLSSSASSVVGLKSENSTNFDDNQVQTEMLLDEANLFEEDFSDYSVHNWDMSGGSSFEADADPAYATSDTTTQSIIETTDVSSFADAENITIYFRIRTNSSLLDIQSGGIYFSDADNTYNYKIGASSYGTSLFYLDGTNMLYQKEYHDWDVDTWHWLRMNTYKDGTDRIIEFLSVLNADTDVPNGWDGDVLPTLSVPWSSITALGLNIRHNEDSETITSWEFDDIIVSTTYPGTVNVVLDPVEGDFTEDFSDYSIHNWDLTNGSNFIVDGNPATVSAGINNFSSIHTTDMGDLSDHTNLTMYLRLNLSTNNIYSRHGGFYFSDGISDYYYSIGVGSSGTYLRYYVDKAGNNDKIYFTSWTENTWHWLKIDTYYDGANRILEFSYSINADQNLPNEWSSGGLPTLSVNWNNIALIGIFISHNFQSEAITEWQFDDIVINKGTAIDIPVEPEYDYTISNYGYDVYKLSAVKGQTIDLSLDADDSGLNLMIVDTNFGYSVLSGFLFDNDPVFNPHNLIDTYYTTIKEITYENIDYEDLWVVVYSLDMIVGDYIDQGYNFISSMPFVLDALDLDLETNLPFTKTGVVTENGDQNWDATEAKYISYSLSEGDILDFYFELDYGDLFILMFDGDSYEDIEESLGFIVDNGYLPDGVDYFTSSENGFLYFSYAPSSSVSGNIAIFSYDSYNPSRMTFTLMTSIELGGVINNNDAGATPTSPAPISIGYLFALPVISLIYYRKKLHI